MKLYITSYRRIAPFAILSTLMFFLGTCSRYDCHEEMLGLLVEARKAGEDPRNTFAPGSKLMFMDSLLRLEHSTPAQIAYCKYLKANILLELGREEEATLILEELGSSMNNSQLALVMRDLGISYLRQGERANCIMGHSAESCLLPIRGKGIHVDRLGSQRAIAHYENLMAKNPDDLESRWLLNLAYMTLGEYPSKVPANLLVPDMGGDTLVKVKPFEDIAGQLGLDVNNMAGGSIIDDFDNDGFLDIITSSMDLNENMHFFHNNGNGAFSDIAEKTGLSAITGGLNMIQADYDNDGDKDIFVLRGAWKGKYGQEPNSLLENMGDGTFKDVTTKSGLLSYHPTQTGTWNDFNNDGLLDLFIGNETGFTLDDKPHFSELYINNGDRTFTNIASHANVGIALFVKGVTSGDYDNDGWQDIFISTMNGRRILLKNKGTQPGSKNISFIDVTLEANLSAESNLSFTTWFWDYDNDGWLDIFACDYTFTKSLAFYAAAEKLGRAEGSPDKILLYHNNHDGTFTSVGKQVGINKVTFAMGGNFGDINNDGYLDVYAGTGNPLYQSLVPNKMFLNLGGKAFADVTNSARVGHLQKGHGVAFADLDYDGDEDIYIEMGGAYTGDAYRSSFFLNPGQNDNNWISMDLEGTKTNRSAIGARIQVTIVEDGVRRSVFRDVNSGGSFGASPLKKHIGIGKATVIEEIQIQWPVGSKIQRFKNVSPNQHLIIREDAAAFEVVQHPKLTWQLVDPLCPPTL